MAPLGSPYILVPALPGTHSESPQPSLSKAHPRSFRFSRPLHWSKPRWSLSRDRGGLPRPAGTSPEDAPPTKNEPQRVCRLLTPHTLVFSHLPSLTLPGHLAFTSVSDHPVASPGQEQALLIPPETLLPRPSQGWLCPRVLSPEKPSWVPPASVDPPPQSLPIGHLVLFPSQHSLRPEMICVFIYRLCPPLKRHLCKDSTGSVMSSAVPPGLAQSHTC